MTLSSVEAQAGATMNRIVERCKKDLDFNDAWFSERLNRLEGGGVLYVG